MTAKTILLHLNDVSRAERLLHAAVPLARAQSAHLIGLTVLPPYIVMPAGDDTGVSVTIDEHRIAYQTDVRRMKMMFKDATRDLPIASEWREADANFNSVVNVVLEHGRTADLIVATQTNRLWGNSYLLEDVERLVLGAGRPVLLVPNEGSLAVPPSRVLVAFDGQREAARALFDALPLLVKARDVMLVWVNPEKAGPRAGDLPAAEICAALGRHGVKPTAIDAHAIGADIGPELLRQAKLQGADLLVMGCYGHSRLRELLLGGASRHVLSHMDLPVLMSH